MQKVCETIGLLLFAVLALTGCMGRNPQTPEKSTQPTDTLYTKLKAMDVYDYRPERALQIVDSAVIVGNISEVWADGLRARIYSWTLMGQTVDSLLHGPEGVRFDSARVIGERLLTHDSLRTNIGMRQDVLEVLVYVARQQQDTARWLRCSQELVEVCHLQGEDAEPEALRTEAEMGAVLCMMGHREQGMARLDSVIAILDSREHRQFNWLDAFIIASKRKINVLSSEAEANSSLLTLHSSLIIPLASRIIDRLNDYERHPQDYYDGTYREPADSTERADYINFYRTQMQSRLTAAYAALGEQGSMEDVYEQIERSVRDVTAREHIARYHSLEQQMLRQEAENRSRIMTFVSIASVSGLLVILLFAAYLFFQKRRIQQKNRVLAKLIEEQNKPSFRPPLAPPRSALPLGSSKNLGGELDTPAAEHSISPPKFLDEPSGRAERGGARGGLNESQIESQNKQLFTTIDSTIRSERLFTNPDIGRQDICERFNIRREVLNQLLTDFAGGLSLPAYMNSIRLSEACRLLSEQPAKTVNAIAEEVGLTPRNLRRLFVERYGMTPTEYRTNIPSPLLSQEGPGVV